MQKDINDAVRKVEAAAAELARMASNVARDAEQRATRAGAAEAEVRQEFGRFKREAADRIEASTKVYVNHERDILRRLSTRIPGDWRGRTFKDLFVIETPRGRRLNDAIEPFVNAVLTILTEIELRGVKAAPAAEPASETKAAAEDPAPAAEQPAP